MLLPSANLQEHALLLRRSCNTASPCSKHIKRSCDGQKERQLMFQPEPVLVLIALFVAYLATFR
jgi:hypothetical protein